MLNTIISLFTEFGIDLFSEYAFEQLPLKCLTSICQSDLVFILFHINIESLQIFTTLAIKLNEKHLYLFKKRTNNNWILVSYYHIVSKSKLYIMFRDPASRNPINEQLKMFMETFLGEDKLVDFQGKYQHFNL